jgi:hypothetical protein
LSGVSPLDEIMPIAWSIFLSVPSEWFHVMPECQIHCRIVPRAIGRPVISKPYKATRILGSLLMQNRLEQQGQSRVD